jgi:hypothetical protein
MIYHKTARLKKLEAADVSTSGDDAISEIIFLSLISINPFVFT